MKTQLPVPTFELVSAACKRFDNDNEIVERSLKTLFSQFPGSVDHSHVLLKVVVLNRLYSTGILAVSRVAEHIYKNAEYIDAAIASGSLEIVDFIAKVKIGDKLRNNYSFATKYCSWHNPAVYPIYDGNVEACLWTYKMQDDFKAFARKDLWNYGTFREIVSEFCRFYNLEAFGFKDIDKFLWQLGEKAVKS